MPGRSRSRPFPMLSGRRVGRNRVAGSSTPRLSLIANPVTGKSADPGFALVADKALVDRAYGLGLRVIPWTINDADTMRAQTAAGADGIITDYPTLLRRVMAQLAMPLPPPYQPAELMASPGRACRVSNIGPSSSGRWALARTAHPDTGCQRKQATLKAGTRCGTRSPPSTS
jgi:Glycerophosphoryl diester phosphodiesterase family